ncbi:hypothetical protein ZIOFF_015049 [Zingiber officinale]|uniref:Uncharacterized protein n=1 Tax=Zingiber officinale TaxID=94328 RepID=A0A8J5I141_ZINOF|nr:hypothetical protein ZIOFF_015049 [Zingiber officinale]
MEESINSSASSLPCSSEESGWTMYLEDFVAAEEKSQVVSCSSIISDAASASSTIVDVSGECRKLRLKREEDDSLQDTASSSFNSPSPKVAENDHSLQRRILKQELKEDEAEFNFIEGTDGYLVLKNTCLVPFLIYAFYALRELE